MDCEVKIIFENDNELADIEAECKEYRRDVVVEIDNRRYKVFIISLSRLQQDFKSEFEYSGYYESEPNMILVQNTTKKEIIATINKMYRCKYFEALDNFGFYPAPETYG